MGQGSSPGGAEQNNGLPGQVFRQNFGRLGEIVLRDDGKEKSDDADTHCLE